MRVIKGQKRALTRIITDILDIDLQGDYMGQNDHLSSILHFYQIPWLLIKRKVVLTRHSRLPRASERCFRKYSQFSSQFCCGLQTTNLERLKKTTPVLMKVRPKFDDV